MSKPQIPALLCSSQPLSSSSLQRCSSELGLGWDGGEWGEHQKFPSRRDMEKNDSLLQVGGKPIFSPPTPSIHAPQNSTTGGNPSRVLSIGTRKSRPGSETHSPTEAGRRGSRIVGPSGEAELGWEVENSSGFHGSWRVKDTDAARRQRRLQAARGHEATLDPAEPDALRARGSGLPNHRRREGRSQQAQGGAGAEGAESGPQRARAGAQCLSQRSVAFHHPENHPPKPAPAQKPALLTFPLPLAWVPSRWLHGARNMIVWGVSRRALCLLVPGSPPPPRPGHVPRVAATSRAPQRGRLQVCGAQLPGGAEARSPVSAFAVPLTEQGHPWPRADGDEARQLEARWPSVPH